MFFGPDGFFFPVKQGVEGESQVECFIWSDIIRLVSSNQQRMFLPNYRYFSFIYVAFLLTEFFLLRPNFETWYVFLLPFLLVLMHSRLLWQVIDKFYKIRQHSLKGFSDISWDDKFACLLHDPQEMWSFNDTSTSKYIVSFQLLSFNYHSLLIINIILWLDSLIPNLIYHNGSL